MGLGLSINWAQVVSDGWLARIDPRKKLEIRF
jgi:hypothetical protein